MLKQCIICKKSVTENELGSHNNACKPCLAARARKRRDNMTPEQKQKLRDGYLKSGSETRELNGALIFKYKSDRSCEECGEKDPRCLEFHHKDPTTKVAAVAKMYANYSWNSIQLEIAKCNLLCANCHRKKHTKNYSKDQLKTIFAKYNEKIIKKPRNSNYKKEGWKNTGVKME